MSNNLNILVVDDEAIMRQLFYDVLQDDGHNVTCVTNGKEALEKIKETSFNIVFLDTHMPEMNGLDTLKSIRSIYPNLPIIMTDSFPTHLVMEAIKEGAVTCIHKPFNIAEIKELISKVAKGID